MATENDSTAEVKASAHARIPSVIVIAIVTALSTGGVTLATRSSAPPAPAEIRDIQRELGEVKTLLRTLTDAVNQNAQDSKNRDAVQDATLASLRNR